MIVETNDGSEDWVPLKPLKKSNPLEVTEYAISNNITDELALN